MKISRIETDVGPRAVVFHEDRYLDLGELIGSEVNEPGKPFYALVSRNIERITETLHSDRVSSITDYVPRSYLIPVPNVNQIRDFYSFEGHVRKARELRGQEIPHEWYEFPAYYYSGNSSLYASDQDVPYPAFSKELDYELEVAVVVGREGRNIPKSEAWSYIFGFVLVNDWSARDQQRKEMKIGLGPSKSKDFATSLGRYIVTVDEMENHLDAEKKLDCQVSASVNGKEYSRGNLKDMHWTFSEMISWASTETALKPGDIIMSGTVAGGCLLELGQENYPWLAKGDVVKFQSDLLGELNSRLV